VDKGQRGRYLDRRRRKNMTYLEGEGVEPVIHPVTMDLLDRAPARSLEKGIDLPSHRDMLDKHASSQASLLFHG
jgi:hypothetical protein